MRREFVSHQGHLLRRGKPVLTFSKLSGWTATKMYTLPKTAVFLQKSWCFSARFHWLCCSSISTTSKWWVLIVRFSWRPRQVPIEMEIKPVSRAQSWGLCSCSFTAVTDICCHSEPFLYILPLSTRSTFLWCVLSLCGGGVHAERDLNF